MTGSDYEELPAFLTLPAFLIIRHIHQQLTSMISVMPCIHTKDSLQQLAASPIAGAA